MRANFNALERINDKNYYPCLAVQQGPAERFILLGSARAGILSVEIRNATAELENLTRDLTVADILKLMEDLSRGNSNPNAHRLSNFIDIFYLPNRNSSSPAAAIMPVYRVDMQLSFLLGVLYSQRRVAFCTDLRYNLNLGGAPVLGLTTPTGEILADGDVTVTGVRFLRGLGGRLGINLGGTVIELYCLARHGYTFAFSEDAKLIGQPPAGRAVTPDPEVFNVLHKRLTRSSVAYREESILIKEVVLQVMEAACLSSRLGSNLQDLISPPSRGPAP